MKKLGAKGYSVVIFLLVLVALFLYNSVNNKAGQRQEVKATPESQELLEYDFENNYPKTVRETVKLHNQYLKAAYGHSFTDEEMVTINKNIRQLMDDELLAQNEETTQLKGIMNDVESFANDKKVFVSYSVAEGSQVEYNKSQGREYAKISVSQVIKVGTGTGTVEVNYILRKDDMNRWKILGWQSTTE